MTINLRLHFAFWSFFYEGLKIVYVVLQFLLPLIIEKLDSDVQSAKLDSLQTLVRNLNCSRLFSKMYFQAYMTLSGQVVKHGTGNL